MYIGYIGYGLSGPPEKSGWLDSIKDFWGLNDNVDVIIFLFTISWVFFVMLAIVLSCFESFIEWKFKDQIKEKKELHKKNVFKAEELVSNELGVNRKYFTLVIDSDGFYKGYHSTYLTFKGKYYDVVFKMEEVNNGLYEVFDILKLVERVKDE